MAGQIVIATREPLAEFSHIMKTAPELLTVSKKETSIKRWIWICGIAAFVLVVLGGIAWWQGHREFFAAGKPQLADWGNYGSYLQGTTASLWSLAGLLIIFVAFLAQKQQLLRQELELEKQGKQFALQQHSIKLQNFENSFFQLLNQQNQIVGTMRTNDGHSEARKCFEIWYREKLTYTFQNEWRKSAGMSQQRTIADEKKYAIKCYEIFYKDYQHELGHYFRNLYHIFKFVNETEVLKDDDEAVEYKNRKRYTSLARAQLSVYELCLLFYNGLGSEGEKFLPLIKKYDLLENLHDRKNILLTAVHEKLYD